MEFEKRCFKIDKPNALAMIGGFRDHGEIRHQSIWVDVAKKPFPILITLNRAPTHFNLSEFGKRLGPAYPRRIGGSLCECQETWT